MAAIQTSFTQLTQESLTAHNQRLKVLDRLEEGYNLDMDSCDIASIHTVPGEDEADAASVLSIHTVPGEDEADAASVLSIHTAAASIHTVVDEAEDVDSICTVAERTSSCLSERALISSYKFDPVNRPLEVSANPKAYYWICAKQGDTAFYGNYEEERNWHVAQKFGRNAKVFNGTLNFFKHLQKNPTTKIGTLFIAGHGNVDRIENIVATQKGILVKDFGLMRRKFRKTFFPSLRDILAPNSMVVLDACLTGNKSVKGPNFAQRVSEVLPNSYVFASQYKTVADPDIVHLPSKGKTRRVIVKFACFDEKSQLVLLGGLKEGTRVEKKKLRTLTLPVIYFNGKEITNQEAVPYPADD